MTPEADFGGKWLPTKLLVISSVLAYFMPARRDQANNVVKKDRVLFEFYLVSYQPLLESSNSGEMYAQDRLEQVQTSVMDCDQLWVLALKMLHLFEETVVLSYPSNIFTNQPTTNNLGDI